MTASITALLRSYGVEAEPGFGWVPTRCISPDHDDSHPSASFNEEDGLLVCHGCGIKGNARGVLEKMGEKDVEAALAALPASQGVQKPAKRRRPIKPNMALTDASHVYNNQLFTTNTEDAALARKYLDSRGFSRADAWEARLGYVSDPMPGHEYYRGRIVIPYLTPAGAVDLRFRAVNGQQDPKYLSLPRSTPRLFDARRVLTAGAVIAVCEGELDALTLSLLCGVPAVGVPGASAWQPHWDRVVKGFDLVLSVGDGDEAGHRFSSRVASHIDDVVETPMPKGQDVNSLYLEGGRAGVLARLRSFVSDTTLVGLMEGA